LFSFKKNKNKFLPSLDGIRAVSIFLVLGSHSTHNYPFSKAYLHLIKTIFNGYMGVNVFFVLSGFLITILLVKEENEKGGISLKDFYLRRIFRIFPVYYLFILILVVISYFSSVDFTNCQWLTSLTFTKNFGCNQWLDGHLWSLSVEEQFYLIWPFVLILFSSSSHRLYFALILISSSFIFRLIFNKYGYYHLGAYSFFTNMDSLMIGSLTGLLFYQKNPQLLAIVKYRPQLIRGLMIVLVLLVSFLEIHHIFPKGVVAFGKTIQSLTFAYLITSYVYVPIGIGYRLLNNKILAYIGVLSYSIYIWQQIFFEKAFNDSIASFPINILMVFIVAFISYNLIELPFLNLKKKFNKQ
jgi:peptidoglycan/LPS O-acetylase OafA/YrhL